MPICKVEGCSKPSRKLEMCVAHHARFKRLGDPLAGGPPKGHNQQFLFDHVEHQEKDECLIWPFGRDEEGYGRVKITAMGKVSAPRAMCILAHGDPPSPKHQSAHSCGKGRDACINPNHLSWKTPKENIADKEIHGTMNHGEKKMEGQN